MTYGEETFTKVVWQPDSTNRLLRESERGESKDFFENLASILHGRSQARFMFVVALFESIVGYWLLACVPVAARRDYCVVKTAAGLDYVKFSGNQHRYNLILSQC
jgi:hypothetical protein